MKEPYPGSISIASAPMRAAAGPPPELLLALAEVGRELATAGDFEERLVEALRVLERRLGARRSVIYRADGERRVLTVDAACGIAPDQFRPRYGTGVAGRVVASGQPVIVPV